MDIVYPDKYFDKIRENFPELSDKQVKEIVYYGIRALYMLTYYGVDIKCQQGRFFAYFGEILQNSDAYKKYRKAKLTSKYRVLYSREKKPFSGKYYFLLSEDLHKQMPKNKSDEMPFYWLRIFKVKEEAELQEGSYLYEMVWPEDVGFKKLIKAKDMGRYELIAKRDNYKHFKPVSTETKEKTVKRSQKKEKK